MNRVIQSDLRPDPVPRGMSFGTTLLLAASCGTLVANLYYAQPLVGLIGPAIGLRPDLYGVVVTLTQFGYVLGLLFLVPLGDMLESRGLIVATICVVAAALGGAALAPNAAVFLIASFLIGLFGTGTQMLVPLAAHLSPEAVRGRVVGNVMSGLLAGILLARPVSSLLSEWVGWRGVFGLAAAASLGLALLLWFRLPSRRPSAAPAYGALIVSMWHVLRDTPILRRRICYQAPLFAAFSMFWTTVPLALAGPPWALSQTGIAAFALAGAAGAVAAPLAGRAADRGHTRIGTGLSLAAVLIGFGLCWTGAGRSIAALAIGGILIDAGVQGNQILSQRAIYALAPAIRSRLNGLFIAASFIAASGGSIAAGAIFAHFGWRGVALAGVACPVVALLIWSEELLSGRKR